MNGETKKSTSNALCPNSECEYDHHLEGANFCLLCGTLLTKKCEDCLSSNPQYARTCYQCGTSLLELREIHT